MNVEEPSPFAESVAFKEYVHGTQKKVKPPWLTISLTGIAVGIAYVVTELFAAIVMKNPYALNFVLVLYGIPAGFLCAWKNKNYTMMTSLQYSTYSALFSVGTYGLIAFLFISIGTSHSFGLILGLIELLIALAIITVFSICVTFAIGAALGTIAHANYVAKKAKE